MFVRTRAAVGNNCSKGELYEGHILGTPTSRAVIILSMLMLLNSLATLVASCYYSYI